MRRQRAGKRSEREWQDLLLEWHGCGAEKKKIDAVNVVRCSVGKRCVLESHAVAAMRLGQLWELER